MQQRNSSSVPLAPVGELYGSSDHLRRLHTEAAALYNLLASTTELRGAELAAPSEGILASAPPPCEPPAGATFVTIPYSADWGSQARELVGQYGPIYTTLGVNLTPDVLSDLSGRELRSAFPIFVPVPLSAWSNSDRVGAAVPWEE